MATIWTPEEKKLLLTALRRYGSIDICAIAKEIPNKTVKDVKLAIKKYKDLANEALKEEAEGEEAPLDTWIEVLKDASKRNNLPDINPLARAIKYIALFEEKNEFQVHFK